MNSVVCLKCSYMAKLFQLGNTHSVFLERKYQYDTLKCAIPLSPSILKMEPIRFSETVVMTYKITRRNNAIRMIQNLIVAQFRLHF
jgi:hypothetical protein